MHGSNNLTSAAAAMAAAAAASPHHHEKSRSSATNLAARVLAGVGALAWPQCRELGLLLHDSWVPAPLPYGPPADGATSRSNIIKEKLVAKEASNWVNDIGDWPESLDGKGAPWRSVANELDLNSPLGECVVQQPLPWPRDASGLEFVGRTVNADGTWRAEEVLALQQPREDAPRSSETVEGYHAYSVKYQLVPWSPLSTSPLPLARTVRNSTIKHSTGSGPPRVWAVAEAPDWSSIPGSSKNRKSALRMVSPLEGTALDVDSPVHVIVDWRFDPAIDFTVGNDGNTSGMWYMCAELVGSQDVKGDKEEGTPPQTSRISEESSLSEQCIAVDDSAGPRFMFLLPPPFLPTLFTRNDDDNTKNVTSAPLRSTPVQYHIEASLRFYRLDDLQVRDLTPSPSSAPAAQPPHFQEHELARVGVGLVKSLSLQLESWNR